MEQSLIEILCCPVTRQPLGLADDGLVERVRARTGRDCSGALLRQDGRMVYPVVNDIPLLVPEEGIAL